MKSSYVTSAMLWELCGYRTDLDVSAVTYAFATLSTQSKKNVRDGVFLGAERRMAACGGTARCAYRTDHFKCRRYDSPT